MSRLKRYSQEQRDHARAMWLAGEQGKTIGLKLGVPAASIHQWATRGGWRDMRQALVEKTEQHIMKSSARVSESIVEEYLTKVSRVVNRRIDTLDRLEPKKASEHLDAARALKQLDDVARRSLGLDHEQASAPRQTINFNLGASTPKPILDITPVDTPE